MPKLTKAPENNNAQDDEMLATAALLMTMAGGVFAAEVEVKMIKKGVMVFELSLMKVAAGDTVKFVAADKGHNAEPSRA